VAIVVADDGDGIPADKMARLFTPLDRRGGGTTFTVELALAGVPSRS
jgi:nitrogen-specific signal transduction histidine kinase